MDHLHLFAAENASGLYKLPKVDCLDTLLWRNLTYEVKDRFKVEPGILLRKQPHNLGFVAADGVLEQSKQVITLKMAQDVRVNVPLVLLE